MEATLSSKGQATIPKAVREHLHLRTGDRFKFFLQPDGAVAILPVIPLAKLKGSLSRRKQPVGTEEMKHGIKAGVSERFRR